MHARKLARMMLATLSLAACLTFFGACVAIVHAHAGALASRLDQSTTIPVAWPMRALVGRVYPVSADYRAGMNSPFRKYTPAHWR